jgi:hypothetical protein
MQSFKITPLHTSMQILPCIHQSSRPFTCHHHRHPLCPPPQVEEEAGIHRSLLQLVAAGRPQAVDDGPKHYLVHPFLLLPVKGVSQEQLEVTLNWESEEYQWLELQ